MLTLKTPFTWLRDGATEAELVSAHYKIFNHLAHRGESWRLRCDKCHHWWKQVSGDDLGAPLLCEHCRRKKLEQSSDQWSPRVDRPHIPAAV